MKICAGIVSFNPDLERILENISAIERQVEKVFIFDNGSSNVDLLIAAIQGHNAVELITSPENKGIAFALNRLCDAAVAQKYSHILLLDQDSVSTMGMVSELAAHSDRHVGIVSPQIVDRNKEDLSHYEELLDHEIVEVKEAARKGVITSGTLTNLQAYLCVGGFDENFFIDYVDYDFDKRLLLEGYKIIRSGNTALIHECGNFAPTWLFTPRKQQDGSWRLERFYSFGHSPFRCYYKSRNRILYTKKYKPIGAISGFEGARQILPQMALTLLFEKERIPKLRQFLKGIRDARKQKIEPYRVKNKE